mgnify:CR=1 FL=1
MVGLNVSAATTSGASAGVLRSMRSRHSDARFLMSGREAPLVCGWVRGNGSRSMHSLRHTCNTDKHTNTSQIVPRSSGAAYSSREHGTRSPGA